MATVVGQSGAWGDIVDDIARRGHTVDTPQDLPGLIEYLTETRPEAIAHHRAHTMRTVQEISAQRAGLEAERGFIRRFFNGSRIRSLKAGIDSAFETDARYPAMLDATIARAQSLPDSAELAGATAELSVIDHLRRLPDSCVVFSDVRLKATRHIYFDGVALQSAQLDHVVLSPAGVFVVETKHWSRSFAESGSFHDPFDQAHRAGYLCYDLLRGAFGKTRVRSIIACIGSLPAAPNGSQVKVLRPAGLCGYVSRFHKQEIEPSRFDQLRGFFERRVGRAAGT